MGAEGNRGYIKKRMYEQDQRSAVGSTHLLIRPGVISTLYTHSDNQSAVPQLHFLASWTSLAGSVSQPESSKEPKSENFARDQHLPNHGDV